MPRPVKVYSSGASVNIGGLTYNQFVGWCMRFSVYCIHQLMKKQEHNDLKKLEAKFEELCHYLGVDIVAEETDDWGGYHTAISTYRSKLERWLRK